MAARASGGAAYAFASQNFDPLIKRGYPESCHLDRRQARTADLSRPGRPGGGLLDREKAEQHSGLAAVRGGQGRPCWSTIPSSTSRTLPDVTVSL
jgi:hypothetical protein